MLAEGWDWGAVITREVCPASIN